MSIQRRARSVLSFLFLLLSAGGFLWTQSAHATAFSGTKSVSIDSGYVPPLASNRSMWQFGIEFEYLGLTLFDQVGEHTFFGSSVPMRLLWSFAMPVGWRYPQYSYFVSNHELGHGTRFLAAGTTPIYAWAGGGGGNHASIFTFFGIGLVKYNQGATTSSGGGTWVQPGDWDLVTAQAGMNNSMMFAEALEDEVATNGGHINQVVAYYRAKTDPYQYADSTDSGFAGDVSNSQTALSAKGISISTKDLRTGSIVALGLSSTTWSYILSTGRYVGLGDPNVPALRIGAFRLPNWSFYQNRFGLSYRVRSALDFSSHSIPFSVETIYRGQTAIEASIGYQGRSAGRGRGRGPSLGGFSAAGFGNTLGGFGARFSNESSLGSSSALGFGGSVFTSRSLEGERNGGRWIAGGSLALELWARLRFAL